MCDEGRAATPQAGDVALLVVRFTRLPAAEKHALPFEGEGPFGLMGGFPAFELLLVISLGPAALWHRTASKLMEGLPQER